MITNKTLLDTEIHQKVVSVRLTKGMCFLFNWNAVLTAYLHVYVCAYKSTLDLPSESR